MTVAQLISQLQKLPRDADRWDEAQGIPDCLELTEL